MEQPAKALPISEHSMLSMLAEQAAAHADELCEENIYQSLGYFGIARVILDQVDQTFEMEINPNDKREITFNRDSDGVITRVEVSGEEDSATVIFTHEDPSNAIQVTLITEYESFPPTRANFEGVNMDHSHFYIGRH